MLGKMICSGCIHAVKVLDDEAKCPFCRVPTPTSEEEAVERIKKRVEMDDAVAMYCLGCRYAEGARGFPQHWGKALELWQRAGELGSIDSYYNVGTAYYHGRGGERDMRKAKHYFELAAIGGCTDSRYVQPWHY